MNCQIVLPALCKKEMGHNIILICAVMIHNPHTDIRQEVTECHLSMMSWLRGEVGYGVCPWAFTLYIFFLSVPLSDRQVLEGDCPLLSHTLTHTKLQVQLC